MLALDGLCYFAATNRFCIMEQHCHLPLLSVVPVSWAHLYLRLAHRGRYYHERHFSLGGLRRFTRDFEVENFTRRILRAPDRYAARYMLAGGIKLRGARLLARVAYSAFPGYV